MTLNEVIFIDNFPTIDLHGFDRNTARVAVNDFINDNVKMKNEIIVIIHGRGQNIVKNTVHDTLRKNKCVIEYKIYPYNIGCTVVNLRKEGKN